MATLPAREASSPGAATGLRNQLISDTRTRYFHTGKERVWSANPLLSVWFLRLIFFRRAGGPGSVSPPRASNGVKSGSEAALRISHLGGPWRRRRLRQVACGDARPCTARPSLIGSRRRVRWPQRVECLPVPRSKIGTEEGGQAIPGINNLPVMSINILAVMMNDKESCSKRTSQSCC